MSKIFAETGGSGKTTYLLLHGLGCTNDVWQGLISIILSTKAGKFIAPDLRGHGRSKWSNVYSLGQHAADLIPIIENEKKLVIIGHSLGAVIALVIATRIFNIKVECVIGLGPKLEWSAEERNKLRKIAAKPPTYFTTYSAAAERYLLVSGLRGLIEGDDKILSSAIFHDSHGFRLAADPKSVSVEGPVHALFLAAQHCSTIRLACGQNDSVTNILSLRELDPKAVQLDGLSHNAHVENPSAVWQLLKQFKFIN